MPDIGLFVVRVRDDKHLLLKVEFGERRDRDE
jgi:hypothetical protein